MAARARGLAGQEGVAPSFGVSLALHAGIIALAMVASRAGPPPPPMPAPYEVRLVAAPPGPPTIGVVRPPERTPTPPPPEPAPSPPAPQVVVPQRMPPPPTAQPRPTPPPPTTRATPNVTDARPVPPQSAPTAGGGPTGGRGTDVANVDLAGLRFPFPAYLNNIVTQITVRFRPPSDRPISAVVFFRVMRDGSVTDIRVHQRSGDRRFDLEALGAVEAAGQARAFGALPSGFSDDMLPIYFTFEPSR